MLKLQYSSRKLAILQDESPSIHHPSPPCTTRKPSRCVLAKSQAPSSPSTTSSSSSPSISSTSLSNTQQQEQDIFSYTSTDSKWTVRPVNRNSPSEIARTVALQTEGFYDTSAPLPWLDALFKSFFQAEVLSEMNKKLQFNPTERFILLVVLPNNNDDDTYSNNNNNNSSTSGSSNINIKGVVEVSYLDTKHVLEELGEPGVSAVPYIASMAVDASQRRQGAATALLEAAEVVASSSQWWGEPRAVLHVFQDNSGAVELYKSRGYEVVFGDASWWGKLGARPRYLMRKKLGTD